MAKADLELNVFRDNKNVNMLQEEGEDEDKVIEFNEDKYFGTTRLEKEGAAESDAIISMHNVHKTYLLGIEGVPALRGVSLTVKRGEFVCIFGTSGGGKTTMLNIIGTIDKPTKGELKLSGISVTQNTKDSDLSTIRLQKVGFVFQTFNLLSSLTALENVEMPMILNSVLTPAERRQRATELLNMVGMGARLNHIPSQLSGGEQQRVTIARAIANKPEILLLDEPTGDLDTTNTLIVMKLLTELNQKENITMVMVTHDVGLKNFADRIIWMRDGKIQRIESVAHHKKQELLRQLDADLEKVQKKQKQPHDPRTEYRVPTDYTTHANFVKRDVPVTYVNQQHKSQQQTLNTPDEKQSNSRHSRTPSTSSSVSVHSTTNLLGNDFSGTASKRSSTRSSSSESIELSD